MSWFLAAPSRSLNRHGGIEGASLGDGEPVAVCSIYLPWTNLEDAKDEIECLLDSHQECQSTQKRVRRARGELVSLICWSGQMLCFWGFPVSVVRARHLEVEELLGQLRKLVVSQSQFLVEIHPQVCAQLYL
jgi:hypothetical protein